MRSCKWVASMMGAMAACSSAGGPTTEVPVDTSAPETVARDDGTDTAATGADATPETALAATGRVDTHLHLGAIASRQSAETMRQAADALVALMDARGVAAGLVVIVPAQRGEGDDELTLRQAAIALHPGRLFLVAGGSTLEAFLQKTPAAEVTPALTESFIATADRLIDQDGAVAFGEMISLHLCLGPTHSYQHVPADHPLYLALADRAAAHDVPIDLHMEAVPADMPMPANLRNACTQNPATLPASIPALHVLLDHNPRAKIVWQHIGWDNVGFMTPTLVRDLLEAHPNLYVALRVEERAQQVASSAPMPNRLVTASGAVDPDWLALIVAKPDRFVIGSDEFVSPEGSPTNGIQSFARTWDLLAALPPEVQSQVGRDNARALYHLP